MPPRAFARPAGLVFLYSATASASLWLAYLLRFDFHPDAEYLVNFDRILLVSIGLKLMFLALFGQFGSLLTYFGLHDIKRIGLALGCAAAVALGLWALYGIRYAPPRAVILTDGLLCLLALCGLRTGFRLLREGYFEKVPKGPYPRRQVGIIGAGDVGASLAKEFIQRRGLGMAPMVFFDDDRAKWGTSIHGVPVHGAPETLPEILRRQHLDEVVIAMPSASGRRLREVVQMLTENGIKFETVPSLEQLVSGQVRVSQIRPVEIQDLLGRPPVDVQSGRIHDLIRRNVVLVTGAGGTIGGELCRQIAAHQPRALLLIERSEFLLFQIEQELRQAGFGAEIIPLVADILDQPRMEWIFARFKPAVVFHAAAHKHVPMMEHQPAEAFRNNTLGTCAVARLAIAHDVARFVFVSTDKAINPTNVMGATKRLAELFLQALQKQHPQPTQFMAVRFGNVLGSSGSVIPTFRRQIAAGGPVTVTHPEVTRYFMTVNEAVGLVLQCATLGRGGEIFVLDMGQPMKIVDLARQLIELSGLTPDADIEIKFVGLRPGEKLYEELNHNTEDHAPTEHPKIMRFQCEPQPLADIEQAFARIQHESLAAEPNQVKLAIQSVIKEYRPYVDAS